MRPSGVRGGLWLCVVSHSVMSDSLWPHGLYSLQVPLTMELFRQEYWSGSHSLFQGIFFTQDRTRSSLIAGRLFTVWTTALNTIDPSEATQKKKNKRHILTPCVESRKNDTDEAICRPGTEMQMSRVDLWTQGDGRGRWDELRE